jgi:DMSO/TMAO reductase YedYZ heme-binding membrane subunit
MTKKVQLLILFSFVISLTQIITSQAFLGEIEYEGEDSAEGLGIAAIIFFVVALIAGIIIFIVQQKPVQKYMKEKQIKLPMKFIWKMHHPLTLIAFVCGLLHALIMFTSGENEDGETVGWIAFIIMSILMVSGFFFKYLKGSKRMVLRVIHFILMITVGIFIGIHALG